MIEVEEGLPCDSAIVESTNTIQKAEFVYRESFYELQAERLGVVVQLRADALEAKLDEPDRVQGRAPHDSVQIDVANPYDAREISRMPDRDNLLRDINRLCSLVETFLNSHPGCDRDNLPSRSTCFML